MDTVQFIEINHTQSYSHSTNSWKTSGSIHCSISFKHTPESLHHDHIVQMVYQHEIEEKGVFKWCTIFNLYKLLKLFQSCSPYH